MADVLLEVDRLSVDFIAADGALCAVDKVSLTIGRGEILGLAGESGSGKSTLARALIRVLGPPAVITGGHVRMGGVDVLDMDEEALRAFRWAKVAMVYQSAMDALSPVLSIGAQIEDSILAHEKLDRAALDRRVSELLSMVGIDPARRTAHPHALSGGMRQRVVIAMALSLRPQLLIMDEPTTALDVVVQRDILAKLVELKRTLGFSILLISHDLPLMLEMCDRIGVLYAGRLVELAPSAVLRAGATHPYTRGLMRAFPPLTGPKVPLEGIPGSPPSLRSPPPGCRFAPRCASVMRECTARAPALEARGPEHFAACHLTPA